MAEKLEIIITAKDKFSGALKSLRGMLPSVKTLAIGAGAGASALGAGLFAIANSTAKAGDEFQKMSLRLGLSTEMLSGMKHAVELSGSSMEAFEKGVRTLAKRMSDADEGLVEAERSFEALGIQVKNADGGLKDLDTIMPQIAEGLATMDDNTKRVALAQELLGRSGTALLPLFKQGAEGLRKMTEEAKALGITFDKTGADEAAAFRDNMLRLQRVFTGIKTQIGTAIIPLFSEWMAILAELGKKGVQYIRENKDQVLDYAESFISAIGKMVTIGVYGIAGLIDAWRGLKMIWQVLKIAFLEFMQLVHKGMAALTDSMASLLDKINFESRFDSIIERVIAFGNQSAIAMANLEMSSNRAKDALQGLIDEPMAIQQVSDFTARIKAAIKKLRALVANKGIAPFTDEAIEKTKQNIKKITNISMEGIYATRTAMINMQEDIDAAVEESTQHYEKQMELQKTLADQTARSMHTTFSNLFFDAFTGDLKTIDDYFKAFTRSMLRAFADMVAQMLVKWAMLQIAMSFGFGGLFGGGILSKIPIIGKLFHEGGVVGQSNVPMRFVPMPRLHGGLRADEFPAILQRGETVLSVDESRQSSRYEQAIIVENLNIHILENAHTGETLMRLSRKEITEFTEDKLIPAFRNLKLAGITA